MAVESLALDGAASVRLLRRGSSIRPCIVDASSHHDEDLAWFLLSLASTTELMRPAFERMAQERTPLSAEVEQEVVTMKSVLATELLQTLSDEQLCVLLSTLRSLEAPTESSHLAPLRKTGDVSELVAATSGVLVHKPQRTWHVALREAIEESLQTTRSPESIACIRTYDASSLRAQVMRQVMSKRPCQLLATALLSTLIDSDVPTTCIDSLQAMAATGQCISLDSIEQLQPALATSLHRLGAADTAQLMLTFSHAASASLDTRVLSLWATAHSAIDSSSSGDGVSPSQVVVALADTPPAESTDAIDPARAFAAAVEQALDSSSLPATKSLRDGLAAMRQRGQLLEDSALRELSSLWTPLLQVMPLDAIPQLDRLLFTVARNVANRRQWRLLAERTRLAATEMTRAAQAMSDDVDAFLDQQSVASQAVATRIDEKHRAARHAAAHHQRLQAKMALPPRRTQQRWHERVKSGVAWLRSKLPSLAKVEIMRDFVQTISLVFSNLYTFALTTGRGEWLLQGLDRLLVFFRGAFNFIAADFTAMYLDFSRRDDFVDGLFIFLAVSITVAAVLLLALVLAVVFGLDPRWTPLLTKDERQQATQRRRHKIKIRCVTAALALCQAVHLPAARLCVEIFFGHDATSSIRKRYRHRPIWSLLSVSAWFLLAYVLGLIVFLVVLIARSAPHVRNKEATAKWPTLRATKHLLLRDASGRLVPFHHSVYAHLVEHSDAQRLCPYRSLYASFEWRWRYYKVVQLVVKVLLTVSLIPFQDATLRASLTMGWTGLSAIMTATAPYIDDYDDLMESSAKIAAAATCAGGVYLARYPTSSNWVAIAFALVVNAANLGAAMVMAFFTLFGSDGLRSRTKNRWGSLRFSDSMLHASEVKASDVLPKWNVDVEIRRRVWQAFWRSQLQDLRQHEALRRLDEDVEAAALHQLHHHQPDEYVSTIRALLKTTLEGCDVCYEPASCAMTAVKPHAKAKTTGSKWRWLGRTSTAVDDAAAPPLCAGFGRLTVVQSPFHCVFDYDDQGLGQVKIEDDGEIATLLWTNFRVDVVKKRLTRQKLRALSAWGGPLACQYDCDEVWTSDTGESISFRCSYTQAVVSVDQEIHAAGFNVAMHLTEGAGQVVDTATGTVLHQVSGRSCRIDGDQARRLLGITEEYDDAHIFSQADAAAAIATTLPKIQASIQQARDASISRHDAAGTVLSSAFHSRVYSNHRISRRALENYLDQEETNAVLRCFHLTHRAALDLVFARLQFVLSDPRIAFWFVFWHDLYTQNAGDIAQLRVYRHELDPDEATSMCYRMLPRGELREWLKKRELWGEWQGWRHWLARMHWLARTHVGRRLQRWSGERQTNGSRTVAEAQATGLWQLVPSRLRSHRLFHDALLEELYVNMAAQGRKPQGRRY